MYDIDCGSCSDLYQYNVNWEYDSDSLTLEISKGYPKCKVDSIIPDGIEEKVNEDVISKLHDYWF